MAMDFTQLLGLAAASGTTLAFLPQAVRTIRTRDTSGISLWMYVIYCAGVLGWLIYGILRNDFPIYASNAITLVTSGTVLVLKIQGNRAAVAGRKEKAGAPPPERAGMRDE